MLQEFPTVGFVLAGHTTYFGEEFFDFVIFESDHFSESVKLYGKYFLLVVLVVLKVLNIKVNHFLELFLHSLQLLVLVTHVSLV